MLHSNRHRTAGVVNGLNSSLTSIWLSACLVCAVDKAGADSSIPTPIAYEISCFTTVLIQRRNPCDIGAPRPVVTGSMQGKPQRSVRAACRPIPARWAGKGFAMRPLASIVISSHFVVHCDSDFLVSPHVMSDVPPIIRRRRGRGFESVMAWRRRDTSMLHVERKRPVQTVQLLANARRTSG